MITQTSGENRCSVKPATATASAMQDMDFNSTWSPIRYVYMYVYFFLTSDELSVRSGI